MCNTFWDTLGQINLDGHIGKDCPTARCWRSQWIWQTFQISELALSRIKLAVVEIQYKHLNSISEALLIRENGHNFPPCVFAEVALQTLSESAPAVFCLHQTEVAARTFGPPRNEGNKHSEASDRCHRSKGTTQTKGAASCVWDEQQY